jgi:hypothetical protein
MTITLELLVDPSLGNARKLSGYITTVVNKQTTAVGRQWPQQTRTEQQKSCFGGVLCAVCAEVV